MKKVTKRFERKHGTPDFPVRVHPLSSIGCEGVTFCNWHSDYEIIYVKKGELEFHVDALHTTLKEGQCAIVGSERIHHLRYRTSSPDEAYLCEAFIIWFDPNIVNLMGSERCQKQFITPLLGGKYHISEIISGETPAQCRILDSVLSIHSLFETQPFGFELKVISELLNILYEVVCNRLYHPSPGLPATPAYEQSERLKRVFTYIDEHYSERIYVSDLANVLNMSTDNFFKYFKKFTQMTPTEYINHYRIGQAEALLKTTDQPVTDISLSTGFDNVSYFIKTFKKYLGITPNRYRKTYAVAEPLENEETEKEGA